MLSPTQLLLLPLQQRRQTEAATIFGVWKGVLVVCSCPIALHFESFTVSLL
jgi:hypothetical protein